MKKKPKCKWRPSPVAPWLCHHWMPLDCGPQDISMCVLGCECATQGLRPQAEYLTYCIKGENISSLGTCPAQGQRTRSQYEPGDDGEVG